MPQNFIQIVWVLQEDRMSSLLHLGIVHIQVDGSPGLLCLSQCFHLVVNFTRDVGHFDQGWRKSPLTTILAVCYFSHCMPTCLQSHHHHPPGHTINMQLQPGVEYDTKQPHLQSKFHTQIYIYKRVDGAITKC